MDGNLGAWARVRLAGRAAAATVAEDSRGLLARFGLSRRDAVAAREVTLPKGAVVARAEALAREVCAPWLVGHNFRSYAWGSLFAARDGLAFDAELLFLAAMFHDLGITEKYLAPEGVCFAVHGGREAERWLTANGVAEHKARIVADAIRLHLDVTVALEQGVEAHLLRLGTGLDVVGQRVRELSPQAKDEVLRAWPRLDTKRGIAAALEEQVRRSPHTRIGVICRSLPFLARVRAAPFAS